MGRRLIALAITLLLFPAVVLAYKSPGQPSGFVNDFAGVLSSEQKNALEAKLTSFEKTSGNQLSMAIINSLDGDTVENYAEKLFKEWGIGKAQRDNGVLILVAMQDREMKIEVGYGLEGALTDAQSFWIINNVMKPAFQQGDYYTGLDGSADKIISATKGEYIPENVSRQPDGSYDGFKLPWQLVIFIVIWLSSILARSKSWWAGGVVGGAVGVIIGLVQGFLYMGLISLAVLVPLGLVLDFIVSRKFQQGKSTGFYPWWIGGGRGGGFGGGGFGGFGGGGSGGGGASGRW